MLARRLVRERNIEGERNIYERTISAQSGNSRIEKKYISYVGL
jgi:hypothetical protein